MAVKTVEGTMNVLQAAEMRIKNAFSTKLPVVLSISGGKDSITLASIIFDLIQRNEVDPKQLTVQFIDEEAIYDDVETAVLHWRKMFLMVGATFEWYCVELKHFNCLSTLADEETFILWDSTQKENWVRKMPSFAITSHPLLKPRIDAYQDFLPRINKGSVQLIGIRAAESLMRMQNMSIIFANKNNPGGLNGDGSIFPIYDWQDDDIWLHIKKNKLDFPMTYLHLYQIGYGRREMRISQFFSLDSAKGLTRLNEHQPGLMNRLIKREPNAYLATIYWESEMFRRSSKKAGKRAENIEKETDYKKKVFDLYNNIEKNFPTKAKIENSKRYRHLILKEGSIMTNGDFQKVYQALVAGDPKGRTYRGLQTSIRSQYIKNTKKEKMTKNE